MSKIEEKIDKDLIQALKQKDAQRVSASRFLKAALKEKSIQKKREALKDEDVIQVIKKQVSQIQDSIDAFKKGNRQDLVEKEEANLAVIKDYLPAEIPKEKIQKTVKEVMEELKPQSKKDFGRVMGQVMGILKGRADGKVVSQVVNEEFSKLEQKKD